jgi:hypothetical protein
MHCATDIIILSSIIVIDRSVHFDTASNALVYECDLQNDMIPL